MTILPQIIEAQYISGYRIELVFNTGLRKMGYPLSSTDHNILNLSFARCDVIVGNRLSDDGLLKQPIE
jgi:hypothetical protein